MERERFDVKLFEPLIVIGVLLEPSKVKKCKSLAPILMFATIPDEHRRHYEGTVPSELRCEAAGRPSVLEPGHPLFWRCAKAKVEGDNLCRQHRAMANSHGIKSWSDQCSK